MRTGRNVTVLGAVTAVALAACGSGSGPTAAGSASPGALTCQPTTDVRSFDRRSELTNLLRVRLTPDQAQPDAVLPAVATVVVATHGAPAGDDLWQQVGQHFGATAARPGQQTGTGDVAYAGVLVNHGTSPSDVIAFQSVDVYTGAFTALCAGRRASGTYVTFGGVEQGVYACGTTPTGEVAGLAARSCPATAAATTAPAPAVARRSRPARRVSRDRAQ